MAFERNLESSDAQSLASKSSGASTKSTHIDYMARSNVNAWGSARKPADRWDECGRPGQHDPRRGRGDHHPEARHEGGQRLDQFWGDGGCDLRRFRRLQRQGRRYPLFFPPARSGLPTWGCSTR